MAILNAEPLVTIGIIGLVGLYLLLAIIVNVLREQIFRKTGILEVDKMAGRKFEEYLQALLKTRGYVVQQTPASGDLWGRLGFIDKR